MDEESGKVIDGTARARHWRRSQPRSTAEVAGAQNHFEAPKSIASSLLVPPAMLDGEPAPVPGETPANGNGRGSSYSADENDFAADRRNIFLSPEAAVAPPPRHPPAEVSAAVLALARRARTASRRIRGIGGLRPRFSRSPARLAAALGVAAACALAAGLTATSQPTSSRPSHSVGGATSTVAFGRLTAQPSLSLAASPFAAVLKTIHLRVSDARASAPRSIRRVRDLRRGATRIVSASARSQRKQVSRSTSTVALASLVTHSASSVRSPTTANEEPAEQSPAHQATQQQPVHYQPPSQPAGPAGLGSQVGSNCNPKCS